MEEDELKAITGPLSIAASENDQQLPKDKRDRTEEILKEVSDGKLGVPYQITLYGFVSHGFAVRADLSEPRAKFAREAAVSFAPFSSVCC